MTSLFAKTWRHPCLHKNTASFGTLSIPPLLRDQVIILTGAGQGIGAATARLLASQGAKLVLSDLDVEKCESVATSINKEANGSSAVAAAVCGDVTKKEFPKELIDRTVEKFGKINHRLHDSQPRSIVNISSTSGIHGNIGQANYATAKAGINGLTKTIAKEWGVYGVRCNSVAYGLIDTRLTRTKGEKGIFLEGAGEVRLGIPLPPGGEAERDEERRKMIPLGRVGNVDEAAGAICFLVSPWAR
ncbi:Methionine aminopeptidase 1 [Phlyctochytrium planicorne]|nr:Methionine aminopeptidase 1 [Phlyctochytrium planicorne]